LCVVKRIYNIKNHNLNSTLFLYKHILKALLIGVGLLSSCFMAVAQESGMDTLKYKLDIDFTLTRSKWEFHNNTSYQFNNTNGTKLLDNWMNNV